MTIVSMTATLVVLASNVLQITYAATYIVGDTIGWVIPTGSTELYHNWTDNKNFLVGDILGESFSVQFLTDINFLVTINVPFFFFLQCLNLQPENMMLPRWPRLLTTPAAVPIPSLLGAPDRQELRLTVSVTITLLALSPITVLSAKSWELKSEKAPGLLLCLEQATIRPEPHLLLPAQLHPLFPPSLLSSCP